MTGGAGTAPARPSAIPRNLMLRIVSAVVLLAILLTAAWRGGVLAAVVAAASVVIIHLEWSAVTEKVIGPALPFTIMVGVAVLAGGLGYPIPALILVALAAVVSAVITRAIWQPLGIGYAALLGLSLLAIRDSTLGFTAIAFLFAVVAATDIAAFFAGRAIGGPKLWPAVSPQKTWAGAIAGFIAANIVGLVVVAVAGLPVVPGILLVSSLLSIAGQLGDLFESSVKRRFGTKDAGTILPGHGGLMDRVDGFVFAGPVAVVIGFLHYGTLDLARGLIQW